MISKTSIIILATIILLGCMGIGALAVFGKHLLPKSGVFIVEAQRSNAPMDELTPRFANRIMEFPEGLNKRLATYYWYAPANPTVGAKLPLVVVLHGAPGKSYAAKQLLSASMATEFPSYILVPQSPNGKLWATPEKFSGAEYPDNRLQNYTYFPQTESLPDVVTLIRQLTVENPIDPDRIYIIGCSLGGNGVYGAVLRYPDIFAGAIAISGVWSYLDSTKMTQVPLLIEHGLHDGQFPATTAHTLAEKIKQSGGNVTYAEFSDMGHECPSARLYDKPVWQWLFSQKKTIQHPH